MMSDLKGLLPSSGPFNFFLNGFLLTLYPLCANSGHCAALFWQATQLQAAFIYSLRGAFTFKRRSARQHLTPANALFGANSRSGSSPRSDPSSNLTK